MIIGAVAQDKPNECVLSVDEKTGIQALERKNGRPMRPGKNRRIETEYTRHGTTCLMAALDLSNGQLHSYRIHPKRKEEDFLAFIKQCCETISNEKQIVFLADQLNTHKSESLVRWVGEQIGFTAQLGTKDYKGILKSQESRQEFLENPEHRIRFVYSPKHCSWLNPIENWFGKLQRHRIKRGNFKSVAHLEDKIEAYIAFYNSVLAKPYKWKFKGFVIAEKKCSQTSFPVH